VDRVDRVIAVDGTVLEVVPGGKVFVELDLELEATGAPLAKNDPPAPPDQTPEILGQTREDSAANRCIWAEKSAKLNVRLIGLAPGDRVRCELSPFEPGRARIIEKLQRD
jgi:translation initiation factor IF-1